MQSQSALSESPNSSSEGHPQCEICSPTNQEIVSMLGSLLLSLRELNSKDFSQCKGEGYGGLPKLLELIFYSKCKNWRDTINCPHHRCHK